MRDSTISVSMVQEQLMVGSYCYCNLLPFKEEA